MRSDEGRLCVECHTVVQHEPYSSIKRRDHGVDLLWYARAQNPPRTIAAGKQLAGYLTQTERVGDDIVVGRKHIDIDVPEQIFGLVQPTQSMEHFKAAPINFAPFTVVRLAGTQHGLQQQRLIIRRKKLIHLVIHVLAVVLGGDVLEGSWQDLVHCAESRGHEAVHGIFVEGRARLCLSCRGTDGAIRTAHTGPHQGDGRRRRIRADARSEKIFLIRELITDGTYNVLTGAVVRILGPTHAVYHVLADAILLGEHAHCQQHTCQFLPGQLQYHGE